MGDDINIPVTSSIYVQFVIPLLNSIIYRLLSFRNFRPVHHRLTVGVAYIQYDTNQSPELLIDTERSDNSADHGSTLTHRMKKGFYDALCAISECDINPELVNAATFSAYLEICKFLRIRMLNPANNEQCLSCREGLTLCKCWNFKFRYLQRINCNCHFGRFGYCECEMVPELFLDLDELRRYQANVVPQFLESCLGSPQVSDHTIQAANCSCYQGLTRNLSFRSLNVGLRCHICRCNGRKWSEFLPP